MHNVQPQMGSYYDAQLGCMVHEEPQMGGIFDDIWKSVSGAGDKVLTQTQQSVKSQIQAALPNAKAEFIDKFLNTSAGQAMVEDAKKGWFDQQKAKVYEAFLTGRASAMEYLRVYKTQIMIGAAVIGVLGLGYVMYKRSSGGRRVAANPRRRKKYHRRISRRRRRA